MNPLFKPALSLVSSALLLATLTACNQTAQQPTSTSKAPQISSQPFAAQENMQGAQAAPIDAKNWLLSSESQGLLIADNNGNTQVLKAGNFESVSIRKVAEHNYIVASIDNEQSNVVIFKLTDNAGRFAVQELSRITPPQAQADTVCLFNNHKTNTVSAFVPDVRGIIGETIVYDIENQQSANVAVREFAAVAEASGCAVSDEQQQLFVAEAELGVWQFNADAESDAIKTPIELVAPYGKLNIEVGALANANDGTIWFTTSEDNRIYAYNPASKALNDWQLSGTHTIESVAAHIENGKAALVMIDDESGAYIQAQVAQQAEPATKAATQAKIAHVPAAAQTTPVAAFGDAADDPAIWINHKNREKSLILGTDKRRGLMVYDLTGKQLQALETGRLNNVDVRQNQTIDNPANTWITASNRTHNSISVYTLDNQNAVIHLAELATNLTEIYGMCMYSSSTGNYVFMNDKSGLFQQYRLTGNTDSVNAELVREFSVPSQPEGCTADDQTGELFLGEEDAGIWFIGAEPSAGTKPVMLQTVNEQLVDDVEGMEIYHAEDGRYLVVSSQGDHSYVLYKIIDGTTPRLAFASKFAVTANLQTGIDGASETDGLTVTATALPGYPEGMLVVQDGYNRMPQQPQNFKIIDWREVKKTLN